MPALPVIAIFDIGKTNKKLFLFNEAYQIVFERSANYAETIDEDGDPCEEVNNIRLFVYDSLHQAFRNKNFDIKAINFAGYGASLVYINAEGITNAPLYNYIKPFPPELHNKFYEKYGGEEAFSKRTASPILGNLNSGMQLYRIKYVNPKLFSDIKYALHLPQYLSYLITGQVYSDITSIGCHTNLWDFQQNDYHHWVQEEEILEKMAPIISCTQTLPPVFAGGKYAVGVGLHDSSSALIPYLICFNEPFILLSTGTWCISLNPFNDTPLTTHQLQNDCLSYLTFEGKPVKASRIFAGNEHEQQVKRLAEHFKVDISAYKNIKYNAAVVTALRQNDNLSSLHVNGDKVVKTSRFQQRNLHDFTNYEEAYHQLITDIIHQQIFSTALVLEGSMVKNIYVDGGFGKNDLYMNLLADAFPTIGVHAASVAQATAVGAALCIHPAWNSKPLPSNLIELRSFSKTSSVV